MKSIEEFRAAQAKALAAQEKMLARAENFAAAGLPIPAYLADGKTHGAIHVSYWNRTGALRTMGEAVAMFEQFARANRVLPFHVLKDGSFTTLHPESRMPVKKNGMNPYKRDIYKNSEYAAKLSVRHNGENASTTAELEFFAIVADELYSVSLGFGTDYIGGCSALAPQKHETRGFANRVVSRKYLLNTNAHALCDAFLFYPYGGDFGPIASGADHRYLLVSDTDETEPVCCSHALGQLQNLAAIVDGNAK